MIQMKNYYIAASICFWDISLWKAWREARDLGDMSQKHIDAMNILSGTETCF